MATLGLACAAAALATVMAAVPLVRTLELKTYDARVRTTTAGLPARDNILIVDIDESSLRKLEPLVGRWPWPRLVHAQAIDFLARGPARAVLYDVLFTEHDRRTFTVGAEQWTGEESDRALADAVKRAGTVVALADAVPEPMEGAPATPPLAADAPGLAPFHLTVDPEARPIVVWPYDGLAAAARAVGHNFFVLDADGPLRHLVPFVRAGDRPLPSVSLATALVVSRAPASTVDLTRDNLVVGQRRLPVAEQTLPALDGSVRIGYRALVPYGAPFRHFSFYDLFYAEQQIMAGVKPDLDPSTFRDRTVIVGTTAAGLSDVFTVPLSGKMPGSEIHANIVDGLLTGRTITPAVRGTEAAALLGTALAVAVTVVGLGPWIGLVVAGVAAGALWWTSLVLFRDGTWLTVVPSTMAIALTAFGGTAYHYFVEGREKRAVKQLFSRFVSRDVYQQLLEDPSRAALGGERRDMTVLFSDIRGFTTISEGSSPEAVVATLNDYFTRMVAVVLAHRGTVDKFVGDMVMALFGAPLGDPDHADHAVEAALAMSATLDQLNGQRQARGEPPIEIGIGVNSGEMVAGLIGSERILSYTVIGDAVNLGSRIESLNKQYGTRILISEGTRRQLKKRYDIRPLGEVTVKGRSQSVSIFEVKAAP